MNSDRKVRIFISSTFRDFRLERDELVKKVFPELRRRCRERFVEVTEVDLRWGVTNEQSLKGETLKICLKEIDKCRSSQPVFFIGLLGERYGWIPPRDYYSKDILEGEDTKWVKEHIGGTSVTELEILHGILNNAKMAEYAFFYFRSSDYEETCWATIKAAYSDSRKEDFRNLNKDEVKKQENLKSRIRKSSLKHPVRDVSSHTDLADKVLDDLWKQINSVFPATSVPDEWERQEMEHIAFAQSRIKGYVQRSGLFESLDELLENEDVQHYLITGGSGTGKSSLLASWINKLQMEGTLPAHNFLHFTGSSPKSTAIENFIYRLVEKLKNWGAVDEQIPDDLWKIVQKMPIWFENAVKLKGSILIVLDAFDQMENENNSLFDLLLNNLPLGVCFVASTLPGKMEDMFTKNWGKNAVVKVNSLEKDECRQIIENYLNLYSKKLESELIDTIINSNQCGNALFLRIILDQIRIRGQHETLPAMIDEYLSCQTIEDLFSKLLTNLEEFNSEHKKLVQDTVGYLTLAKRGLTESELLELLSTHEKPSENPMPRAQWSPLFLMLDDFLINRNGRLGFFHGYMDRTIKEIYLSKEDINRIHKRFGEVALTWDNDKFGDSLKRYGLEFGAYHLRMNEMHNELWELLNNELFRIKQEETFKRTEEAEDSLNEGILAFIAREGKNSIDDERLCVLAVKADELGNKKKNKIKKLLDQVITCEPTTFNYFIASLTKELGELTSSEQLFATIFYIGFQSDIENQKNAQIIEAESFLLNNIKKDTVVSYEFLQFMEKKIRNFAEQFTEISYSSMEFNKKTLFWGTKTQPNLYRLIQNPAFCCREILFFAFSELFLNELDNDLEIFNILEEVDYCIEHNLYSDNINQKKKDAIELLQKSHDIDDAMDELGEYWGNEHLDLLDVYFEEMLAKGTCTHETLESWLNKVEFFPRFARDSSRLLLMRVAWRAGDLKICNKLDSITYVWDYSWYDDGFCDEDSQAMIANQAMKTLVFVPSEEIKRIVENYIKFDNLNTFGLLAESLAESIYYRRSKNDVFDDLINDLLGLNPAFRFQLYDEVCLSMINFSYSDNFDNIHEIRLLLQKNGILGLINYRKIGAEIIGLCKQYKLKKIRS